MKKVRLFFGTIFIVLLVSGCLCPKDGDVIYQVSTIDALTEGVYDGEVTFDELKKHGDFGIGTFDGLDGEMIGFDGEFYQIRVDGVAYPVPGSVKTPFSAVTFFDAETTETIDDVMSLEDIKQHILEKFETKNIFYAIKISGTFSYVKARSVPKQERPYPRLIEVIKEQAIFEFHDTEGTIAGFWCPAYVNGINVSGFHLHFLTADKNAGGHLFDCVTKSATIEIDEISEFCVVLPESEDFYRIDFSGDEKPELNKIEKR